MGLVDRRLRIHPEAENVDEILQGILMQGRANPCGCEHGSPSLQHDQRVRQVGQAPAGSGLGDLTLLKLGGIRDGNTVDKDPC